MKSLPNPTKILPGSNDSLHNNDSHSSRKRRTHRKKTLELLARLTLREKLKRNRRIERQNRQRAKDTADYHHFLANPDHFDDPQHFPRAGSPAASYVTIEDNELLSLVDPLYYQSFATQMPEFIAEWVSEVRRRLGVDLGSSLGASRLVDIGPSQPVAGPSNLASNIPNNSSIPNQSIPKRPHAIDSVARPEPRAGKSPEPRQPDPAESIARSQCEIIVSPEDIGGSPAAEDIRNSLSAEDLRHSENSVFAAVFLTSKQERAWMKSQPSIAHLLDSDTVEELSRGYKVTRRWAEHPFTNEGAKAYAVQVVNAVQDVKDLNVKVDSRKRALQWSMVGAVCLLHPASKIQLMKPVLGLSNGFLGVGARRPIPAGTAIWELHGLRPYDVPADLIERVPVRLLAGPMRFINHGCKPNCERISLGSHGFLARTTRDVRVGELISFDFGKERFPVGYKCQCLACTARPSIANGIW
ncbi:hypothetical protein C8J56DRAFT_949389 [Mycena floridula]|nr:hypothetical protein C8J56DRAFT_949389 [Mycena floridula]